MYINSQPQCVPLNVQVNGSSKNLHISRILYIFPEFLCKYAYICDSLYEYVCVCTSIYLRLPDKSVPSYEPVISI